MAWGPQGKGSPWPWQLGQVWWLWWRKLLPSALCNPCLQMECQIPSLCLSQCRGRVTKQRIESHLDQGNLHDGRLWGQADCDGPGRLTFGDFFKNSVRVYFVFLIVYISTFSTLVDCFAFVTLFCYRAFSSIWATHRKTLRDVGRNFLPMVARVYVPHCMHLISTCSNVSYILYTIPTYIHIYTIPTM